MMGHPRPFAVQSISGRLRAGVRLRVVAVSSPAGERRGTDSHRDRHLILRAHVFGFGVV